MPSQELIVTVVLQVSFVAGMGVVSLSSWGSAATRGKIVNALALMGLVTVWVFMAYGLFAYGTCKQPASSTPSTTTPAK